MRGNRRSAKTMKRRPLRGRVPVAPVSITLPASLFVATYARLPVRIRRASGLTFEDLEFRVPEGSAAGEISESRDATFDPRHPTIMLLAGYQPGSYRLQIFRKGTRTLLAEQRFDVTEIWSDRRNGPSFWFTGRIEANDAGFFGGGPVGPQNLRVFPAPPVWRVAVVLVDCAGQRYSTDPATIQGYKDVWYQKITSGHDLNWQLQGLSVHNYYQEVSFGRFNLQLGTADIYGPVHLPGVWTDYFTPDGDRMWLPLTWQAFVPQIQTVVNLSNYDTVILVAQEGPAQSGDVPGSTRTQRGYASVGKAAIQTTGGSLGLAFISIENFGQVIPGSNGIGVIAHELGHNLGLRDQYYNVPAGRSPGQWDLMADVSINCPGLTLPHRLMLGWVDAGQVATFDFATGIAPQDQTVTLSPMELPAPINGKLGIEVRIADGLNYYFEYRKRQPGQTNDFAIPLVRDDVVLGTDFASTPNVFQRPWLLTLAGGELGFANSEYYEEADPSTTAWPATLKAEISGITGTQANVRIKYGVNGKPDPAIRPWPASSSRSWQSPDIEVQNARNLADPANWFNVPWELHLNKVVATITNRGNIDAPGVIVDFFVSDLTVANAPLTQIGADMQYVSAGDTVNFETLWVPQDQHPICLVVRIRPYRYPPGAPPGPPALDEPTTLNNLAQSNYFRFISRRNSPAQRVVTSVRVVNPYAQATRIYICPGQTNPVYRTYLGNMWLELQPGEGRDVEVMFEYAPLGDREYDARFGREAVRKFGGLPNEVTLMGWTEYPQDRHVLIPGTGVQIQVVTGKTTRIEGMRARKTFVEGRAVAADGKPVRGGKAIVTEWSGRGRKRREKGSATVTVGKDGTFRAAIEPGWRELEAYFVAPRGYADCAATLTSRSPS